MFHVLLSITKLALSREEVNRRSRKLLSRAVWMRRMLWQKRVLRRNMDKLRWKEWLISRSTLGEFFVSILLTFSTVAILNISLSCAFEHAIFFTWNTLLPFCLFIPLYTSRFWLRIYSVGRSFLVPPGEIKSHIRQSFSGSSLIQLT